MESFKIFINELADMSGEYISKNFGGDIKYDLKADASPVTAVDKNTEEMIRTAIRKRFPDHGIIGEEYGNDADKSEYTWVIDPIDGTKSFISHVPLFGTLIALRRNGKPILGLINQPILKERILGDCNECLFNGKRVHTSAKTDTNGITLLTSDSRNCVKLHSAEGWNNLSSGAAISRTWGDCYGYMLLCRGIAHVMCDALLEVWDFSALLPALQGAGASFSDWSGGNNIGHDGGLVASCNATMHGRVLDILNCRA